MGFEHFGTLPGGDPVWRCTLRNDRMSVEILSLGAVIQSIRLPDKGGKTVNVLLGRGDLEGYLAPRCPAAAVIGRVANRIGGHGFQVRGKAFELAANEGNNTLHSGPGNYARRNFAPVEADDHAVTLALRDHGEGGFPGEVDLWVRYRLDGGDLEIRYQAIPSEDTPLNITNHAYFNLAGHDSGPVDGQELQLFADFYTPAGGDDIPTGEILKTSGTALDFSSPRKFGPAFRELEASGDRRGGFNHNFVLAGEGFRRAAIAFDSLSGRKLEAFTDMPGLQLFTMNHTPEGTAGHGGAVYGKHGAFCLETQFFPDSVHHPHFPSCIAPAGKVFSSTTVYRFSV